MENQPKFPAEEVSLPSKGLLYPKDSPLGKGKIEMKYMTAREEDILTNSNYIKKGVAIDKLLESLIVTPNVDYNSLLLGDKNALMIAARILGYGADYDIKRKHPETNIETEATIDLSQIEDKNLDESLIIGGKNEFSFTLPTSKNDITFKLLTQGDDNKIDKEIEGMKKLNKATSGTIRLKHTILSIDGNYDTKIVRDYIETKMLARDARALRKYITNIQPGINMNINVEFKDGYIEEDINLPISLNFFWPDAGI